MRNSSTLETGRQRAPTSRFWQVFVALTRPSATARLARVTTFQVLIVDDDPWILKMVTTVLGKRGYRIHTATDGQEAYLKAIEVKPDLIVTDIMMPKMDGWTLVRSLRQRSDLALTPVTFLPALGS